MLQIKDIRKQYTTGDLVQTALDGVSLTLRDNEFVAILGPSGSGKTTMLNIIGGLDRYDSGDLIINGISTKKYTDRDWDSYRNHTIGFIFQSYNLIPHQTVLSNVELALTISGISRGERRRRAKEALEAVGLGDQLHKRPNQMSGGQMQRVAIARALVNDPDILLADEPTGALDTATSIQVMDLLKEVSRDRLVVMVTHNPELAESYANRIVRVKDGQITDDSNPYRPELEDAPPQHRNMGKASMSFLTALTLSFNNLWTKKARTLLTAFAGSIGIIGIALIMSLSTGFQKYIDKIQEDTLTNYPLTIQSETADMTAALSALGSAAAPSGEDEQPGTVTEQQMMSQMFSQVGKNDLRSFKAHMDDNMDQIGHTINAIQYSYGVKPQIYLADTSEKVTQVNPATLFGALTGSSAMSAYMDSDVFYEMMDNIELLDAQYEVLQGRWPEYYNEMVLVLSDPHRLQDYTAYSLGLRDPEELEDMIAQVMAGEEPQVQDVAPMQWSYDELMGLEFRLVSASARYSYNSQYKVWEDMSDDLGHMRNIIAEGEELKIVGIVCAREGVSSTALSAGIAYTSDLTRHVIEQAAQEEIVTSQLEKSGIDVFTGTPFGQEREEEGLDFQDMISVDTEALTSAFEGNVSEAEITARLESYLRSALSNMNIDTAPAQKDFLDGLTQMGTQMLEDHIAANADPPTGAATVRLSDAGSIASAYLSGDSAGKIMKQLSDRYQVPQSAFAEVYQPLLTGLVTYCVAAQMETPQTPALPEAPEPPEVTLPTAPTEATEPAESTEPSEATQPTESTEATQPTETTEPSDPTEAMEETQPTAPTVPEITLPDVTIPEELPEVTLPPLPEELPEVTVPEGTLPEIDVDLSQIQASLTADGIAGAVSDYAASPVSTGVAAVMSATMMEATIRNELLYRISGIGNVLMDSMGNAFTVDESKFAEAFQFEMDEDELRRLMEAMSNPAQAATYEGNLHALGYAEAEEPTAISIYFVDFERKEEFIDFLEAYNQDKEAAGKEEQVISYADVTGIMMSSVRTIIDAVSYALIAFVAVSLVVSSIMIGIITYISVMERTKEIGVLRAIGASKGNISQVFNAETFIIGLCSGLLGVGITLLLLIPGNQLIWHLTGNQDIVAQLPALNAAGLICLSVLLTLIGGFIPAKKAAKKDPVIALRSE